MPVSPPKPRTYPGCGALVRVGSGRCGKHPREAWAKKIDAPVRISGRRLQAMPERLFTRNPLRVECERLGRVTLAVGRGGEKSGAHTPETDLSMTFTAAGNQGRGGTPGVGLFLGKFRV